MEDRLQALIEENRRLREKLADRMAEPLLPYRKTARYQARLKKFYAVAGEQMKPAQVVEGA